VVVTARSLQSVLRLLSHSAPAAGDDELLRQFVGGDESAFTELVRRHGRLVWAVCRHLTGCECEADDAFQATFLVLLKNAGKVRDAGRLSAWLHGVAYRVCAKARQASKRRLARERAAAVGERNGSAIADSAWDRALAAVHEEAGKLPEALRVPFVLCCLEGMGTTEAAAQLGWKLGTLSGRLTRAKDAVLAKLEARGLTLGVVAGLGLATAPASAVAKAAGLARAGSIVPQSILQLTQGVIGMSVTSFKVLAAAVLVACGLGVGVGTEWMATADAQTPAKPGQSNNDPQAEVKRLQMELERALRAVETSNKKLAADEVLKAAGQRDALVKARARLREAALEAFERGQADAAPAQTAKWEYDFVAVSDMDQAKFVKFLQEREGRGWEYAGTTPLARGGKTADSWVFRRPTKGSGALAELNDLEHARRLTADLFDKIPMRRGTPTPEKIKPTKPEDAKGPAEAAELARAEAELARLHEHLAILKGKVTEKRTHDRIVLAKKDLPMDAAELAEILQKLASRKFKNANFTATSSASGLSLEGDKEAIDWAMSMIKKLADK